MIQRPTIGFTHAPSQYQIPKCSVHRAESRITSRASNNEGPEGEAAVLIEKLVYLALTTNRGFQASTAERRRARDLIFSLERLNPTLEPASAYYADDCRRPDTLGVPTISGKWTLIYTDAPDITSLDTTRNPFSTAKLGRIGQDCNPPYVKNVIEWMRPNWASALPLSGSEETRVLQKVVTSASATPEKPNVVNLKIAGLELVSPNNTSGGGFSNRIQKDGIIAGLISSNPVDLKGPLNPPFGQFKILYLDDEVRITLTSQYNVAVNRRCNENEEWF